jgi:hypothetical protein
MEVDGKHDPETKRASTMPWTDPESLQVLEGYWANGGAECPKCNAYIRFNYQPFIGGYLLFARCPRGCGGFDLNSGQDPRKGQFRNWTEEEANAVLNDYFRNQRPSCPVDGAEVQMTETPTFEGNMVHARCRRCGHGWQQMFART